MKAVRTGDTEPPKLPNVVITPEIDPDDPGDKSLHVVQSTADAAKLNPAAMASCKMAMLLFAV